MNTQLLKYVVEVSKVGSISKAAENLYMNQPHLSKAIRELEEFVGVTIFQRTSKGVIPTKKGQEFLIYANRILAQLDEMQSLYKTDENESIKFDISVPRADYISCAFSRFLRTLDTGEHLKIDYRETNSVRTIKNVARGENNLGIIRYELCYENYFLQNLEEKDIKSRDLYVFEKKVILSKNNKFAEKESLSFSDLSNYIRIQHGDISVPSLPLSKVKEINKTEEISREILVYERASEYELLSKIENTFMISSPIPEDTLTKYDLVQIRYDAANISYKDVLIYNRSYRFSKYDKKFLEEIEKILKTL